MEEHRTEKNQIEENQATYDMSGLKTVFWGLLFTAVNIRIQGFDIVPDVIGYIIVITGLGKIEKYEEKFLSAKRIAYFLAVLALINIYQEPAQENPVNFSAGVFGDAPLPAVFLMIAGLLANLWFFFNVCTGMKNLLLRVGDSALAGICDDRWKLILATEIGLTVSILTFSLGAAFAALLTLVFGVLGLIALVLLLLLVHHAYKSIDGKEEM